MLYLTRKELREKGVSQYLAIQITKNLDPVSKKGNFNLYKSFDIIDRAKEKKSRKRTHQETKKTLKKLIAWLEAKNTEEKETDVTEKTVSFGIYLARKRSEDDVNFLKVTESNIKKMKEVRDEFREIINQAKQKDPEVFTKI